ncbi:MAG: hypothetical protein ACKVT0_04115, partial [Planctomycetaceae bacterium]
LLAELEQQLAEVMKQVEAQQPEEEPATAPADPATAEQPLSLDEMLPRLTPEQAKQLAQMLESKAMQKAMAMAARAKQTPQKQNPNQPPPTATQPQPSDPVPEGNLLGTLPGKQMLQIELLKLDPASRQVILNMQPAQREEIMQGLREEGPEGYREYIRDYFERLTKVKTQQQK